MRENGSHLKYFIDFNVIADSIVQFNQYYGSFFGIFNEMTRRFHGESGIIRYN